MPRPPRSPLPRAALLGGALLGAVLALACGPGARQAAAQAASQAAPAGIAEAIATYAPRHGRVSDGSDYKAPGHAVLDLAAHDDLRPPLTINAGLFNVFGRKYVNAQDVIGLAANTPKRDLYAQPGRYAAVNLSLRW
ncbi:MAG: hypothetical protein AAGC69_14355 [Paracraurococcus sp.]